MPSSGGLVRTMSVLGLMQGGPGAGDPSILKSMSRSQLSARSLLRNSGSHSSPVAAESKDESPSKVAARFKHAAKKLSAVSRVAAKERPRHLPRFLDLALVAHDLNQRAQAHRDGRARDIMGEEAGGRALGETRVLRPRGPPPACAAEQSLHAFKDEVGGAALEAELMRPSAWRWRGVATAAFPAFRAALEKLFPPGYRRASSSRATPILRSKTRRARGPRRVASIEVNTGRTGARAKRLSDCLRASVVISADAARTVAAYEALSKATRSPPTRRSRPRGRSA